MNEKLLFELRKEFEKLAVGRNANGRCIVSATLVKLFFSNGKELSAIIHGITDAGWVKIEPVEATAYEPYSLDSDCNFMWRLDSISGYNVIKTIMVL